jgi:hypothetical protein
VKNDIIRAIADPAMSKEISALTDELIENKRLKMLQSGNLSGRNLVLLNAKAMGFWKEYEKQKNSHLSQVREQMLERAKQKNEF